MKYPLITAAAAILALAPLAAHAVPSGYTLNWSDEFNGAANSQPNSAVWGFDLGGGGWGNNELETYVNSVANCHVIADGAATDGKALQIEMQTDTSGRYYSARINTGGKKTVGYGYIEYRAQMPNAGAGYWPACWMLGNNIGSVGWPACGEIDIMEEVNGQNNNHGSLHGPNYNPTAIINGSSFTSAYHTYGALWQANSIAFYVDGNVYETQTSAGAPGGGWVWNNNPNFFLINLAMGGNFPGGPNSSTHIPGDLKVDYLRYYVPGGGTTGTTTGSTSGGSVPTGVHTLTPQCATGSRLDLTGGSTANGNKLQIWAAAGNVNQQWNISVVSGSTYKIQSNAGAVCLDSGGTTTAGGAATVWACQSGNANQQWTGTAATGGFTFKAGNSGLCLDVSAAGNANGTAVLTYTCNGTNAQTWAVN